MNAVRLRALTVLTSLCVLAGGAFLSSPPAFAAAPEAPVIEEEAVSDVSASSATFRATVNPGGADTTYRFEVAVNGGGYELIHGPEGEPLAGAQGDAGAGNVAVPVEIHPQDLAPNTSYRFRLVASNSVETVNGLDQSFTTQTTGGFALPDGRQWEMVSPPKKEGALLEPISEAGMVQASTDGDAITYLGNVPTEPEPLGFANKVQVFSTRGSGGWGSVDLTPQHEAAPGKSIGFGQEYRFFTEDLSLGIVQPFGPFTQLSDDASYQTAYLHSNFSASNVEQPCTHECYRPLVTGCPPVGQACATSIEAIANVPPGTIFARGSERGPEFVGGTPDLSHVVLKTDFSLTPEANIEKAYLYEWFDGKLAFIGEGEGFQGISKDGSLVFLEKALGLGQLLVYDLNTGETIPLDGEQESGSFAAISDDGSKVILRMKETGELRECEVKVAAGKLTCTTSVLAEGAAGMVGMSKDGSWLYFASPSILTNVPNRNGEQAVNGSCKNQGSTEGLCNLYAIHDGNAGWEAPRLVAELSGGDSNDWAGNAGGPRNQLGSHTARISPNGEWLAFMSQERRASYDTRDAVSGHPDEEVYLYNADSSILACVSCNPTGARPVGAEVNTLDEGLVNGNGVWSPSTWLAANIPGWTPNQLDNALYQSRYLSDSGRLYFNSSDALVPQDVNGAEDVYEYEPPGVGGCDSSSVTFSQRSDGCVDLISSGTSGKESGFLDASENGGDVFFMTSAKLASQDIDTSLDVYDAHECTSTSPCLPAPVPSPPPCVTGDACKPAPMPQPTSFGAPSSATFSGAGNVTPSSPASAVKPRTLTRAQKLARALRECRAKKHHKQRATCERQARKRYAAKAAGKANANKRGK